MNNKRTGSNFEKEACDILANDGYWVHLIAPDARGAQPFDIIAVRDGRALAIDCKTCVANTFNISRLEDNQIMAFNRWLKCGNEDPIIMVKHAGRVYYLSYSQLSADRSIKLGG